LLLQRGALPAADGQRLPMDVAGPPKAEGDHPSARRLVREAVDQDEGAGVAIGGVGVERHGRRGRQIAVPDLVEAQGFVRQMRQGLDVDPMLQRRDGRRHRAGPDLQEIRAAGNEGLLAEPDHVRGELVDTFRRIVRVGEQIAAGNVDLTVDCEGDGVSFGGVIDGAVERYDLLDPSRPPRACDQHRIARADRARNDRARETPEFAVRAVDPLDRKAERPVAAASYLDRMEVIQQGRSLVPRHPRRLVVTLSPDRAAIGMTRTERLPRPAAKAKKWLAISSKQRSSNPTRSILLTAMSRTGSSRRLSGPLPSPIRRATSDRDPLLALVLEPVQ
jgi:hypothetical protein